MVWCDIYTQTHQPQEEEQEEESDESEFDSDEEEEDDDDDNKGGDRAEKRRSSSLKGGKLEPPIDWWAEFRAMIPGTKEYAEEQKLLQEMSEDKSMNIEVCMLHSHDSNSFFIVLIIVSSPSLDSFMIQFSILTGN